MTADPSPWPARLVQGWCAANADWIALFRGRARRSDVWLIALLAAVVGFFLSGVVVLLPVLMRIENNLVFGAIDPVPWRDVGSSLVHDGIRSLGSVGVLVLPVLVRRCHDRGRSAWWLASALALTIVPYLQIVAWLWLLADLGLAPGMPGPNRYGPSPR